MTVKLVDKRKLIKHKPKPQPVKDDECERCGMGYVAPEPENKRTKCRACGAYSYDWVRENMMLKRLNGKHEPRDKVRAPSYSPPELLDFTKTELVDLVWRLAELHISYHGIYSVQSYTLDKNPSVRNVVRMIMQEYEAQRKKIKKPKMPKRMSALLERMM